MESFENKFIEKVKKECEKFYKRTNKRLTQEQLSLVEKVKPIYTNQNASILFHEDKVKIFFNIGIINYIIDIYFGKDEVLIGKIEHGSYSLKKIDINSLDSFLTSLLYI